MKRKFLCRLLFDYYAFSENRHEEYERKQIFKLMTGNTFSHNTVSLWHSLPQDVGLKKGSHIYINTRFIQSYNNKC